MFSKYSEVGDSIIIGMLVYFKDGGKHIDIKNDIEYYHRFLKYHQFNFKDSSYAVLTYQNQIADSPLLSPETEFQEKIFQNNSVILKCEVLFHYMNYLESFCLGARSGQFDKLKNFRVTLGTELVNFLNFKSDKKWAFFSFTGSVVSGIIESI